MFEIGLGHYLTLGAVIFTIVWGNTELVFKGVINGVAALNSERDWRYCILADINSEIPIIGLTPTDVVILLINSE